ncbi:hypothetical protein G6L37_07430 [Agrobacterium rubi]|nr:hypothetical protein [Agrobacterium rubi]NTF25199.1 hypothetical protein [Agrobacterium rubi]
MSIVLGLDIDGVVLNYGPSLLAYGLSKGLTIGCEWHEVDMYNMAKAFPELDKDGVMALITEFSEDEAFSAIREMDGFTEALAAIRAAHPDLRLVAITSAGVTDRTIELRRKNLEHFGFDEIHVLPLMASKEAHLAELPAGSIFVDDLKRHVDSATKVGLTGILVRQPYNAADTHDFVMGDWKEGAALITSILNSNRTPAVA